MSQLTRTQAISTVGAKALSFDHLLPPGVSLYPHQTCGVATALLERRLVLGDQMGLGKAAQALVALEAAGAYPAVVVCPAMLVADWVAEVGYFLPRRRAQVASGAPLYWGDDIVIVSYSLLYDWVRFFIEDLGPRAVVLDESHTCANLARRRSRAALALGRSVPAEGLVLSLTGAPVLNEPADVIAQLKLIGRFEQFLGPAGAQGRQAPEAEFKSRWCRDLTSQRRLHRALCQSCYVRRTRADVGAGQGRRNVVLLSVGLAAYQQLEAHLAARLRRKERDGLEQDLAALRRLAGEAKVAAAAQWVDNYLRSNPGRALVVYYQHPTVGGQLGRRWAGQRVLLRPLSGRAPLSEGLDAVFVELGWSLEEHDRLAQGAGFVWYLLAARTIDLTVLASLEASREAGEGSWPTTTMDVASYLSRLGEPPRGGGYASAKIVPLRRRSES